MPREPKTDPEAVQSPSDRFATPKTSHDDQDWTDPDDVAATVSMILINPKRPRKLRDVMIREGAQIKVARRV